MGCGSLRGSGHTFGAFLVIVLYSCLVARFPARTHTFARTTTPHLHTTVCICWCVLDNSSCCPRTHYTTFAAPRTPAVLRACGCYLCRLRYTRTVRTVRLCKIRLFVLRSFVRTFGFYTIPHTRAHTHIRTAPRAPVLAHTPPRTAAAHTAHAFCLHAHLRHTRCTILYARVVCYHADTRTPFAGFAAFVRPFGCAFTRHAPLPHARLCLFFCTHHTLYTPASWTWCIGHTHTHTLPHTHFPHCLMGSFVACHTHTLHTWITLPTFYTVPHTHRPFPAYTAARIIHLSFVLHTFTTTHHHAHAHHRTLHAHRCHFSDLVHTGLHTPRCCRTAHVTTLRTAVAVTTPTRLHTFAAFHHSHRRTRGCSVP